MPPFKRHQNHPFILFTLCTLGLWLHSCSTTPSTLQVKEPMGQGDPATEKMVRLLERIAVNGNFQTDGFLNNDYVRYLENIEPNENPARLAEQKFNLSRQYLFSGRTEDAIAKLMEMHAISKKHPIVFSNEAEINYLAQLGISYLRQGEQDNCLDGHNPETCIFPIAGGGVHQKTRGSAAAIPIYEDILRRNPQDMNARWLLNIAHMTLGTYPEGLTPEWLIAPDLWKSDTEIPRFPEVAMATQTALLGLAGSVVIEDFNGDGFFDILASTWGLQEDLVYLENDRNNGFTDKTKQAGLTGMKGGLNMIQADIDNDGHKDILVLRGGWRNKGGHHPNSLFAQFGWPLCGYHQSSGLAGFFANTNGVLC